MSFEELMTFLQLLKTTGCKQLVTECGAPAAGKQQPP